LVVANITGAAVGINCTFRSASCDGIRFGDQTSQASANGVSKFVGHTHSSGSTWAWVTRIWFQDAFLVFTDVVTGSTIRVNNTFGFAASNGVGVGDQTGFTSANWVSAGSNGANSSRTARAGITGVRSLNTFLLFTNIISGAIGVNDTFGSASSNGIGFGDQTGFTSADSIAKSICSANSSRSTRTGIARVRFLNTSLVFTNVTGATVGINYTFWAAPGDSVWLWDQTRLTSADSIADVVCGANSSRSTGTRITRVRLLNASLVQTNFASVTVGIPNAFRSTPGDGVRFWDHARNTVADGVTDIVDGTDGVRSTGRGLARIYGGSGSSFNQNVNRG